MSRYERLLKMKEIKRLVKINQYYKALKIMETIDVKRIRDISELNVFAEIYTQNERYDEAMDTLLRIYEKSDTRKVLYQLVQVSIKRKAYNDAEEFYEEYCKSAPSSPNRFILRYKIDKAKGADTMTLIHSLEEHKNIEYDEKWAFELAKLYHRAGLIDECINECNDIILWFGSGIYVERAKVLKYYYTNQTETGSISKAPIDNLSTDGLDNKLVNDHAANNQKESNLDEENLVDEIDLNKENIKIQDESYLDSLEEAISETEKETARESLTEENKEISAEDDMDFLRNLLMNHGINKEVETNHLSERLLENDIDVDEIKSEDDSHAIDNTDDNLQHYSLELKIESMESENNAMEPEKETMESENNAMESEKESMELEKESMELEKESMESEKESMELEKETIESEKESMELEKEFMGSEKETMESENNSLEEDNNKTLDEKKHHFMELEDVIINGININMIFKNFFQIDEIRQEVCRYIDTLTRNENSGNHFIITGYKKSGKTELGKMIASLQYKLRILKTPKVAKISALKLNQVDLDRNKSKLLDGCLIIDDASELTQHKIKEVIEFIKDSKERITVILEDQKDCIDKLLENNPEIYYYFTNRIHIPAYEKEELADFAYEYLKKKKYILDTEAMNIVQDISKQISNDYDKEDRIEAMIDSLNYAILRAEARNESIIKEMIKKGVYKENICKIIAKDFMLK